jgi:hypothetical protein
MAKTKRAGDSTATSGPLEVSRFGHCPRFSCGGLRNLQSVATDWASPFPTATIARRSKIADRIACFGTAGPGNAHASKTNRQKISNTTHSRAQLMRSNPSLNVAKLLTSKSRGLLALASNRTYQKCFQQAPPDRQFLSLSLSKFPKQKSTKMFWRFLAGARPLVWLSECLPAVRAL